MKIERYLITTADENTWVFDRPVLFLGDWCLLESRKHVWLNLDYEIVPYHWHNQDKLLNDVKVIRELYAKIIPKLSFYLNNYHSTNFSERSWKIIIGPWLSRFIQVIFDRYKILEYAFENYKISGISYTEINLLDIVAFDYVDFGEATKTDKWNYLIYSFLYLNLFKFEKNQAQLNSFNIQNLDKEKKDLNSLEMSNISLNFRQNAKFLILSSFNLIATLLTKNNNNFFYQVYITRKMDKVRLGYYLKDLPIYKRSLYRFYKNYLLHKFKISSRDKCFFEFDLDITNNVENAINLLINKTMPISYLEGFSELSNIVKTKPLFHDNPKRIITSIGLWHDELFKIWVANKIQSGSLLIGMQHGGDYGTSLFSLAEEHEIDVSDVWLNWGWKGNSDKIIKAPMLIDNRVKVNISSNQNDRKIVIICMPLIRHLTQVTPSHVTSSDLYYNDIKKISLELMKNCKSFVIRLFPGDNERGDPISVRLANDFKDIQISSEDDFYKLTSSAKIVIHTYDGTTFLEDLVNNNPCMLLINPKITPLRESAKEFFDELCNVGICHYSVESLSYSIQSISDIERWWADEKTVIARKFFANNFAYRSDNPIKYLSDVIKSFN